MLNQLISAEKQITPPLTKKRQKIKNRYLIEKVLTYMRRASLHMSECPSGTGSVPSCRRTSGGYTYLRRASLHMSEYPAGTGSVPSCRRTSGGYTYLRRASLHMSGCLVGVRSIMKEKFRRIYLHEESIIACVWVSSGYRLSSIVKENLRRIYLHEESIIAHV